MTLALSSFNGCTTDDFDESILKLISIFRGLYEGGNRSSPVNTENIEASPALEHVYPDSSVAKTQDNHHEKHYRELENAVESASVAVGQAEQRITELELELQEGRDTSRDLIATAERKSTELAAQLEDTIRVKNSLELLITELRRELESVKAELARVDQERNDAKVSAVRAETSPFHCCAVATILQNTYSSSLSYYYNFSLFRLSLLACFVCRSKSLHLLRNRRASKSCSETHSQWSRH
jgi:chromosome segregation ATPase